MRRTLLDEVLQRDGSEVGVQQLVGALPKLVVRAILLLRTVRGINHAQRDTYRPLHRLKHLQQRHGRRIAVERKTAASTAYGFDETAFYQIVLDTARKCVRDILPLRDIGHGHIGIPTCVGSPQDPAGVVATTCNVHQFPSSPAIKSSKRSNSRLKSSTTAFSSPRYSSESSGW